MKKDALMKAIRYFQIIIKPIIGDTMILLNMINKYLLLITKMISLLMSIFKINKFKIIIMILKIKILTLKIQMIRKLKYFKTNLENQTKKNNNLIQIITYLKYKIKKINHMKVKIVLIQIKCRKENIFLIIKNSTTQIHKFKIKI